MHERRQNPRKVLNIGSLPSLSDCDCKVTLVDGSSCGLHISTSTELPLEVHCFLEVSIPRLDLHVVLDGRKVRSWRDEETREFHYGLEFRNAEPNLVTLILSAPSEMDVNLILSGMNDHEHLHIYLQPRMSTFFIFYGQDTKELRSGIVQLLTAFDCTKLTALTIHEPDGGVLGFPCDVLDVEATGQPEVRRFRIRLHGFTEEHLERINCRLEARLLTHS